MKEYKQVYYVFGFTEKGRSCNSGWTSDIDKALQSFVRKYPRFKGSAELKEMSCEVGPNGILIGYFSAEAATLKRFDSTKQIKATAL